MATESGPNGLYNSAADLMEQAMLLAEQELKDGTDFSKSLIDYKPDPKKLKVLVATARKVLTTATILYTTYILHIVRLSPTINTYDIIGVLQNDKKLRRTSKCRKKVFFSKCKFWNSLCKCLRSGLFY